MKNALHYIVSSIVTDEKSVKIDEETNEMGTTLSITVAPEEMGKVIGKNGKIIRAIRNVMKIPAMKKEIRISVNLNG